MRGFKSRLLTQLSSRRVEFFFIGLDSSADDFNRDAADPVMKLLGEVHIAMLVHRQHRDAGLEVGDDVRARVAVGPEHVIFDECQPRIPIDFMRLDDLPVPMLLHSVSVQDDLAAIHCKTLKGELQMLCSRRAFNRRA